MLRYEPAVGIIRFYPTGTNIDDLGAVYEASCTILWESSDTIWIKGLSGKFNRDHLASIIKFIFENNIKIVKSYRNSGNLPFLSRRDGRYCEIDIDKEKDRLMKFINRPPSL